VNFLKNILIFYLALFQQLFSLFAWLVTYLFLKETVTSPISIAEVLHFRKSSTTLTLQNIAVSQDPTAASLPVKGKVGIEKKEEPLPLRELLTPHVLVSAANYAFLAIVDIAFRAIQPLFFSTPIELGGLGLPPHRIGLVLSAFGILNGVFQVFFFAKIHDRWGTKNVYITGLAATIPVFASFPLINWLAKTQGLSPTVWAMVGIQVVISVLISLSYGCIFIYITNSAPNKASMGATNGFCQMIVSVMRAIGPAGANSLFSLSIDQKHHYMGGHLVYYVLEVLAFVSIVVAAFLPRQVWNRDKT